MVFHLGETLAVVEIKPLKNEFFRIKNKNQAILQGIQNSRESQFLYQNYSEPVDIVAQSLFEESVMKLSLPFHLISVALVCFGLTFHAHAQIAVRPEVAKSLQAADLVDAFNKAGGIEPMLTTPDELQAATARSQPCACS